MQCIRFIAYKSQFNRSSRYVFIFMCHFKCLPIYLNVFTPLQKIYVSFYAFRCKLTLNQRINKRLTWIYMSYYTSKYLECTPDRWWNYSREKFTIDNDSFKVLIANVGKLTYFNMVFWKGWQSINVKVSIYADINVYQKRALFGEKYSLRSNFAGLKKKNV